MCKLVTNNEETERLFRLYFSSIDRGLFIEALKFFRKKEGYGLECVCITFDTDYSPGEEGYFEGIGVKLSIFYPAWEEDVIAILSYQQFFDRLVIQSKIFLEKYPEREEEVKKHLKEIEKVLLGETESY